MQMSFLSPFSPRKVSERQATGVVSHSSKNKVVDRKVGILKSSYTKGIHPGLILFIKRHFTYC